MPKDISLPEKNLHQTNFVATSFFFCISLKTRCICFNIQTLKMSFGLIFVLVILLFYSLHHNINLQGKVFIFVFLHSLLVRIKTGSQICSLFNSSHFWKLEIFPSYTVRWVCLLFF
uniref:Uncharacterized protein n=1 Tax=Micrurus lemniscatus lemniscatus TaxID=129467 RepID=A0A2D4I1R8_MICLE